MNISSDKKMNKNDNSFFITNTQIPQNKTSTLSIVSTNNTKSNTNEYLKKIETPLDFIKRKKQFKIHDLFDVKGTNDFLASKDAAMEVIHLEDEIIEQNKKENKNEINTITSQIDSKNDVYIKEKNHKKSKYKKDDCKPKINNNCNKKYINTEVKKKKTPKFKNKNKEKKNNNEKCDNNSDDQNNSDNNILIIEKRTSESHDSNFYRFIIDNANDSDDQFQKKLEKVIKKVETQKKKQEKENAIYKSATNKNKKSYIPQKKEVNDINEIARYNSVKTIKKRNDNLFIFSEKAKNLMTNDNDIELSSIGHNYNIKKNNPNKKNIKIIN